MTAEVVIANAGAVALAADSAVTIGNQKIYNSALKVFSLSKVAPVGIMVYGSAGLLGVPWEPIIKTYRSSLRATIFPTLEEHANDFLASLPKRIDCFPDVLQENWLKANVRGYFRLLKDEFQQSVQDIIAKSGSISAKQTLDVFGTIVEQHWLDLRKRERLRGIGQATEKTFRQKHIALFRQMSKEVFQNLDIRKTSTTKLYDIGAFLQTRDIFSDQASGVVIAGFGAEDIFPVISSYQVDGVAGGSLKAKFLKDKSHRIEGPEECGIVPFAQEDMVYTFMRGMNPAVHSFINEYLQQMCKRFPELIDDAALSGSPTEKKKLRSKLQSDVVSLFGDFQNQLDLHTRQQHISPILEMVGVLPKDELAAMAESLVNLTAFKRKMTQELETVGGPIDVAVISKGDGLVWVQRKHYFPRELNQHFFTNYFRELQGERNA